MWVIAEITPLSRSMRTVLFFTGTISKKLLETAVYTQLPMTPPQATQCLNTPTQAPWLKQYKWGYKANRPRPTAYILLKKKEKYFQGARPIINYRFFTFETLLRATAIVLQQIHRQTYPHTFGHSDLPTNFQQLQRFFEHMDLDAQLTVHNQDLAGFFASIPADRILTAIQDMLTTYTNLYPHTTDITTFSINIRERNTKLRMFRGRQRQNAQRLKATQFQHLLPICELSLQASVFTQLGRTFQQMRGSAIGNQLSPILAKITVSHTEQAWLNIAGPTLQHNKHRIFITRYVDNRLTLCDDHFTTHPHVATFLDNNFYQQPVTLEYEPDFSFLVCVINPTLNTLSYIQPSNTWQFQAWHSTSAKHHKLSAVCSRVSWYIESLSKQTFCCTTQHRDWISQACIYLN